MFLGVCNSGMPQSSIRENSVISSDVWSFSTCTTHVISFLHSHQPYLVCATRIIDKLLEVRCANASQHMRHLRREYKGGTLTLEAQLLLEMTLKRQDACENDICHTYFVRTKK
jgi:hypothetical protein